MIANQLKKDDFLPSYHPAPRRARGPASSEEIKRKLIEEFAFTDEDLAVAHEKSGTPITPIKIVAAMANHSSTRTTQFYDRRPGAMTLDDVERVLI
ncbi:hypothetical protein [Aureimonas pseudogalii]|uniref:Uncharacterized protein n=1 Tax=Aureimonas pseudogalii TaxID=1744844 RepID=A0A7W6H8V8_9HYPH|nr:hypothetical protein [Aureimonas pseudogalii]MBB4000764.1 hypothetical protein [Aureimonas pseudogalii]